jgi:putative ribosome biogenesis GTPase RsgA
MQWPAAMDGKQIEASGKNVFVKRDDIVNNNRDTLTLKYLNEGRSVIWTGASGIGKSLATNSIILSLLQDLNISDANARSYKFNTVIHRVDQRLFVYSRVAMKVKGMESVGKTSTGIFVYTRK